MRLFVDEKWHLWKPEGGKSGIVFDVNPRVGTKLENESRNFPRIDRSVTEVVDSWILYAICG